MATIKDFFSSSNNVDTVRPTHGTSGQCYLLNCGSWCCHCLPSSATTWTMESWGQGGGGAGSCCCMWDCQGGAGSDYAYSDWPSWSCGNSQNWCNCVCMCFCCSPANAAHPGQFTRMSNCTASYFGCVGGGQAGYSCCNYGGTQSYLSEKNASQNPYKATTGGGSGSGTATNITGLSNVTCDCWNSNCTAQGDPYTNWGPQSSGGGGGGSNSDGYYSPNSVSCTSGIFSNACFNNTKFCVRGSCGWSNATSCDPNCIRGGGGSSYGGGFVQCKCNQPGLWAYTGCPGKAPGGGAVGAGACGGGCCCGGVGGMGAMLMSWDN